jgi:methionyl-tRNA synthetase
MNGGYEMPTIEDFAKFEFKVARIIEAEDHPNADRLYVLKVDVGETETKTELPAYEYGSGEQEPQAVTVPKYRQVVAGIKKFYNKEDLVGKYVIVVNNLEPATLRGVESQGMILAASDDIGLSVIVPEKEIKIGSKVK